MNREQRRKCKNTYELAARIEQNSNAKYEKYYEEKYQKDLDNAIGIFLLAIKYTLHFNEITNLDNEQLKDFMQDLLVTVDYFRTRRIQSRRIC